MTKRLSLLASPTALGGALSVRSRGGSSCAKVTSSAMERNSAQQAINISDVERLRFAGGESGTVTVWVNALRKL